MAWISVFDKLPPACKTVLVVRWKDFKLVQEVYYVSTHPKECVQDDSITHWQNLPPMPEQEHL